MREMLTTAKENNIDIAAPQSPAIGIIIKFSNTDTTAPHTLE